jgi:hypothetical protein
MILDRWCIGSANRHPHQLTAGTVTTLLQVTDPEGPLGGLAVLASP